MKFYKLAAITFTLFVFKHLSGIHLRSVYFIVHLFVPLSRINIVDGYRQMAPLAAEFLDHSLDYCVSYLLLQFVVSSREHTDVYMWHNDSSFLFPLQANACFSCLIVYLLSGIEIERADTYILKNDYLIVRLSARDLAENIVSDVSRELILA